MCAPACAAWRSTKCTPTSAVNLALTLEQPGHVASPSPTVQHSPPCCARAADGHMGYCCCALLFQLLCRSSPLFSTPPVSFLATHKMHTSLPAKVYFQLLLKSSSLPTPPPQSSSIFSFIHGAPPRLKQRLQVIKRNKMETLTLPPPTGGRRGRDK